jgi:hypothetical protein
MNGNVAEAAEFEYVQCGQQVQVHDLWLDLDSKSDTRFN